jgi:hypothetical protein
MKTLNKPRVMAILMVMVFLAFTGWAETAKGPKMGPLPITRGGTGATTAAAARTALGVSDSTSTTAYVDQSIETHSLDSSSHGCDTVASASALALKADVNGSGSERFQANVFYGGGLGHELTNGDSVLASAGSLVTISTTSGKFAITTTGGYPDGVLFADTATNTAGYVLMAGVAHNIIVPGNATSGDYIFIDGTTAGAASTTANPPQTATETWQYIGRCILTTTTGTTSIIINR